MAQPPPGGYRTGTAALGPFWARRAWRLLPAASLVAVVVGGANVYRDSNHTTMTYARTMAPYYRQALVKAGLLDRG